MKAGPRVVGVSFVQGDVGAGRPSATAATGPGDRGRPGVHGLRQCGLGPDRRSLSSRRNREGHARAAARFSSASRRAAAEERACATKILSRMARLAYRRPVTKADVQTLLEFFDSGRHDGGSFDSGIQFALERMLVDPDFLLRVHRDPASAGDRPHIRLSDLEVASRLSFFLWSSIPDDRLLTLAERGELTNPATLEKEVRRMLADPRATDALVNDFAAQWLNLRRVGEVVVDPERYPNYDESLLQAFKQETEMFVASTLREDRSVDELLNADYTFVNERLARHYGIPGIYGSRFRRVTLPNHDQRGGLLAEGALLATTSYPDRTSPVLRGKWLLNNIFGLPIPPPPPGVDTNLETKPGATPTIHARAAGAAPAESLLQQLSFGDRSAGVCAGEFRRDRRLADRGRIGQAGRRERRHGERREDRRACGIARAAARAAGAISAHGDGKADGLCAGAQARILRSAGGAQDRPRCGGATNTAGRRSFSGLWRVPRF